MIELEELAIESQKMVDELNTLAETALKISIGLQILNGIREEDVNV